ncbi:hypothetical protein GGS23DRAFT_425475 [Durotheca rogersii]|uniref:uncharacterized protein n=1 Tax=Durotheca rogersii TaxID=419775 RepID=UPI00221EDDF2|nr:uncharacterized protein GGS23DRAFT_425475 [Durotheca rogersii]KAI5865397.1 hypothetical protein GGS23DRAFT_425475 [Durotheca rogersii]
MTGAPVKRYATSHDWARLQAIIMRLYLDEDKTLDEVKSHMEEHHGFFATLAMYKKRFSAWNAYKNLRFDEVLQILYLKKRHDPAGPPVVFFIRDREVNHGSLQVYLSRNPSIFAKLEAGAAPNPEAVRDVSCRSPPSSRPSFLSKSDIRLLPCPSPAVRCTRLLPASEDMFRALHLYLDQCFETRIWSWSSDSCWNTRGRHGPSALLSSLLDRSITAALSVTRQVEPIIISRALDTAFAMLVRVFRNPPPNLVTKLLSAAAHLDRIGREEIRGMLLRFCQDLAPALLGPNHSLAKFWRGLIESSHVDLRDVIGRVLDLCKSEFSERLGPGHALTTETYLHYFDVVERRKDPREQLQSLERCLSHVGNDFPDRPLHALLRLEIALATCKLNLEQQRLDKAEEALTALDPGSLAAKDESFRCVWLGYVQCARGDYSLAERSYQDSVMAARRTGSRDCLLDSLFQLEAFFLHVGKHLEAERIRMERFLELRRLGPLIWADQENMSHSLACTSLHMVMMIRMGSSESSARWRPSTFAEVTNYADPSNLGA